MSHSKAHRFTTELQIICNSWQAIPKAWRESLSVLCQIEQKQINCVTHYTLQIALVLVTNKSDWVGYKIYTDTYYHNEKSTQ